MMAATLVPHLIVVGTLRGTGDRDKLGVGGTLLAMAIIVTTPGEGEIIQ